MYDNLFVNTKLPDFILGSIEDEDMGINDIENIKNNNVIMIGNEYFFMFFILKISSLC